MGWGEVGLGGETLCKQIGSDLLHLAGTMDYLRKAYDRHERG